MVQAVPNTVSVQQLMNSIHALPVNALANKDIHISGIEIDSRRIQAGMLYCAVVGNEQDGHTYIQDAVGRGALVVLLQHDKVQADKYINASYAVFAVDNVARVLGRLAAAFYANPGRKLQLTGITGTNGKTTVAYALAQAMAQLAGNSGYLGTIGNGLVDQLEKSELTTGDAISVQRWLANLAERQAKHVALEVSSHALSQYRVDGCEFDAVVFTNLSQDHLDYHGNMYAYGVAKKRLFHDFAPRLAVINADDVFAMSELRRNTAIESICYGQSQLADLQLIKFEFVNNQTIIHAIWRQKVYCFKTQLIGRFNVMNMLAVIAVLLGFGYSAKKIASVLPKIEAPAGRMQWFKKNNNPLVVVDYAHTPDALAQVLLTLREICQGQLVVCFGCGGDRDRSKRSAMGEIAQRYADCIWITDDNPRTESAQQIVKDILEGITKSVKVEHDRALAIRLAISQASDDDVVLIAGKGHEDYQIIGQEKLPFDDCQQVKKVLEVA